MALALTAPTETVYVNEEILRNLKFRVNAFVVGQFFKLIVRFWAFNCTCLYGIEIKL